MTEQERIKEIEERQLYVWPHLTAESLEHDLCIDVRWLLDELKRVTAERDSAIKERQEAHQQTVEAYMQCIEVLKKYE